MKGQTDMQETNLELKISTELAPGVGLPAEIMFNYDELKTQLTAYVAKYDGLVVGDGEVAEARHIRADINRVIGQLTKAGTETKKRWNEPLDTFIARVKELVGIAKPIEAKIGEQIKAHDAAEREKRRKTLEAYLREEVINYSRQVVRDGEVEFAALPDDVVEAFVTSRHWAICVKDEMLNVSASENRARGQLLAEVRRCRATVEHASRLYGSRGSEWVAKACYALARWDFDETTACRDVDRQIQEAERLAARAKPAPSAEELAKQKLAEVRSRSMGGQGAPVPVEKPAEQAPAEAEASDSEVVEDAQEDNDPEMSYTLRITGPRSKLFKLRDWLNMNGLSFERA